MAINVKKHLQNDWLKGSDIGEGNRLTVTIEKAYDHTFPSGDESSVLEFLELDQKLSLNKGRLTKMVDLFGDDSDEWLGRQVILYAVDVTYQGKTTLGVAIAAAMPRKKAPQPVFEDGDDTNGDVVFSSRGRN
jgi:hypothetical protein